MIEINAEKKELKIIKLTLQNLGNNYGKNFFSKIIFLGLPLIFPTKILEIFCIFSFQKIFLIGPIKRATLKIS
jgi:hypothetical protein